MSLPLERPTAAAACETLIERFDDVRQSAIVFLSNPKTDMQSTIRAPLSASGSLPLDRDMSMRSPSDWALLFLQLSSSVFLLQVHGLPKLLHFNQEMQVIEDPFGLGGLPSARN